MTLLKTFCGCSTLRTGSIVAAIAGIILAIIGIIVIFTVSVDLRTIVLDFLPKWVIKIIVVINFAMTIFISILLLFGIIKRNIYLMLPWVILGIMLAVGLLVSVLYTSINFYIDGDNTNGTIWIVVGLISVIVYVYMWMVVYSFFRIVKEEWDRRAEYEKAPFRRHY
jgi:hypothetical protein